MESACNELMKLMDESGAPSGAATVKRKMSADSLNSRGNES